MDFLNGKSVSKTTLMVVSSLKSVIVSRVYMHNARSIQFSITILMMLIRKKSNLTEHFIYNAIY